MEDFKVFYDEQEDILYLATEGKEEEVVEISPGINMELDSSGKLKDSFLFLKMFLWVCLNLPPDMLVEGIILERND